MRRSTRIEIKMNETATKMADPVDESAIMLLVQTLKDCRCFI